MCGLAGCQTAPKRTDNLKEGKWSGRVLIRDKKTEKSEVVVVDLNAVRGERLRLDVTSTWGHHLASLVLIGDDVKYLLVRTKKFYQGKSTPQALRPLVSVPLDPTVLFSVLFDQPLADKNWTCTNDQKGFVAECRNLGEELVIQWVDRRGDQKTVRIDHGQATLQLSFNSFSSRLDERAHLFELKPPKNFSVHTLR